MAASVFKLHFSTQPQPDYWPVKLLAGREEVLYCPGSTPMQRLVQLAGLLETQWWGLGVGVESVNFNWRQDDTVVTLRDTPEPTIIILLDNSRMHGQSPCISKHAFTPSLGAYYQSIYGEDDTLMHTCVFFSTGYNLLDMIHYFINRFDTDDETAGLKLERLTCQLGIEDGPRMASLDFTAYATDASGLEETTTKLEQLSVQLDKIEQHTAGLEALRAVLTAIDELEIQHQAEVDELEEELVRCRAAYRQRIAQLNTDKAGILARMLEP